MGEIKKICIDNFCADTEEQKWAKDYPTLGDSSHSVVLNDVENNDASGNADGSPVGYATAEGYNTQALGAHSHTEGINCIVYSENGHAEGMGCEVGISEFPATAKGGHAEGISTKARGEASHAEGAWTEANGDNSHAEGAWSEANGHYAHAEGQDTRANGNNSHAEGYGTTAIGFGAHAEGYGTTASHSSHAEGRATESSGDGSHASGICTKAYQAQTAIGQSNIDDKSRTYAFMIGNGGFSGTQATTRSNALTVDWQGNVNATAFNQTSDEALKKNIKSIGESTRKSSDKTKQLLRKSSDKTKEFFMSLRPISFDWVDTKVSEQIEEDEDEIERNLYNDGSRHFGLIAQEVQKSLKDYGFSDYGIVKEPVCEGEHLALNYIELIPLMIKMIQDQQKEIDNLKALVEGDKK